MLKKVLSSPLPPPVPKALPARRRSRHRHRVPQRGRRQGWLLRSGRRPMTVTVERVVGDIAVLTFSAPPVNLYSIEMHADFDRALDEVEASLPRALLIRAEGKIVSGGVDVSQFHDQKTLADTKALYDRMIELPDRVAALPIPTFFAAHALTLTWAFEVALACDIIVASREGEVRTRRAGHRTHADHGRHPATRLPCRGRSRQGVRLHRRPVRRRDHGAVERRSTACSRSRASRTP